MSIPAEAAFAVQLKLLRLEKGLSQTQLAERAELSSSYIVRLEGATRFPTRTVVARISQALRLTQREKEDLLAAAGFVSPTALAQQPQVLREWEALLARPNLDPERRARLLNMLEDLYKIAS